MKNQKTKFLVIFEDGNETLEGTAKRLKTAVGAKANVKIRAATGVVIAEVLAADAYAFGVHDADAPHWAEFRRLFRGMNLAGRKAAFFGTTDGMASLSKAFADAELSVVDASHEGDPAAMAKTMLATGN